MIIIDMGSGNTCRNSYSLGCEMIDALTEVDPHRLATLKWQLWDQGSEPQCVRLDWELFESLVEKGTREGYRTTASVFDKPSLDFLLRFDIPFVKLANRAELRTLARYIPRGIPIVASYHPREDAPKIANFAMVCVSQYPAPELAYGDHEPSLRWGISDHTVGLDLWRAYHPQVYEKHLRLERSTGGDSGRWAATPMELKEVFQVG